jgi:hypothetical protein
MKVFKSPEFFILRLEEEVITTNKGDLINEVIT